ALDEIFGGGRPRRHPTVEALTAATARQGLAREPLEGLIDARYRELDAAAMTTDEALEWARGTGGGGAELGAPVPRPPAPSKNAREAGAAWTLGRRVAAAPELRPVLAGALHRARSEVRRLSPQAFPAVAHAALATHPGGGEFARRLKVTWAVARGRI